MYNYYGEEGCCLTCNKEEKGSDCLCYECKCKRCIHYWKENVIYDTDYICNMAQIFQVRNEIKFEIWWFFDLKIKHETEKAILITYKEQKAWLPKSQIKIKEKTEWGLAIGVPFWLIKQKPLFKLEGRSHPKDPITKWSETPIDPEGYSEYDCNFE